MKFLYRASAFLFLLVSPTLAQEGQGFYTFSVSASSTDPLINTATHPGAGYQELFLWSVGSCNDQTTSPGWSAAQFRVSSASSWTLLHFAPAPGTVSIHYESSLPGINLAIVNIGSCSTEESLLLGTVIVAADEGDGVVQLDETNHGDNLAVAVDCQGQPGTWAWPEHVRFLGYSTTSAIAPQDAGQGCTNRVLAVESSSWGRIKTLYREG